jgi:hypothetical protein
MPDDLPNKHWFDLTILGGSVYAFLLRQSKRKDFGTIGSIS